MNDRFGFQKLSQQLEADEKKRKAQLREACTKLLQTPDGRRWYELAREHFGVDRPRFRKDDDNHDAALIRDGQAEVFYWVAALADDPDDL